MKIIGLKILTITILVGIVVVIGKKNILVSIIIMIALISRVCKGEGEGE